MTQNFILVRILKTRKYIILLCKIYTIYISLSVNLIEKKFQYTRFCFETFNNHHNISVFAGTSY